MSSALACFLFYFHCFSLQFPQPNPLQNFPCSGWPVAVQRRGEGLSSTAASLSPPALVYCRGRCASPHRAVRAGRPPSTAESPGELVCSGGRCRCGLPPMATHPVDAGTGCRAPLVATFRSSLPFGDLHKGCHSAGG